MTTLTAYDLNRFTGSEVLYRHWLRMRYTEGVKYLADRAGAHWIVDAIASHQPNLRRVPFQLWELVKQEGDRAVLTCREDSDRPLLVRQEIAYTDFPLASTKLYCCNGVLMLPSEY
ncbi:hypothetical protein KR51_00019230 [Rubidibacter lacunae KORDI 51-2]|uniref:DUF6876 domain-containing protein n=1 Tax=Rubidibacter lacunae KORDI 51-2 TaxID=582515 RepID=U5DI58_9CHRO|nr:DUF6876 family protein [Rubidibacter lacunae]ERN41356.1 hypothetical protein KR51_00019230 [Rubidibacter lacunae KORDI 51-2]